MGLGRQHMSFKVQTLGLNWESEFGVSRRMIDLMKHYYYVIMNPENIV
jgi:hypothetical protein